MLSAGRGRDGPCGPPRAQIRTSGLRSIRLLAQVVASPLMTSAMLFLAHINQYLLARYSTLEALQLSNYSDRHTPITAAPPRP